MKKRERQKNRKNNGITLIALVITIIVLLILAGVAIATLTGDNGILTRANDASERTRESNAREQVQLAVQGSYDETGKINLDNLNTELSRIDGLTYNGNPISDSNKISSLPATVVVDGYEITINGDGSVTVGDSTDGGNTDTGKTDGSYDESKGVNTPKLGSNMELVVYEDGEWVTDETNAAYSYVEQAGTTENGGTSEWANAKVTIDGVESYFVWIPRYAYKIDSENRTIDVKFLKDTGTEATDETICKYANDSTLNTSSDYIIHPAFTADIENGGWDTELPGLWIGKYESARSDSEGATEGTSTTIKIQPNVTSWRNETIGDMYTYAYNYARNLESHMLKNSEWGAVAYLTHSQYGRNGTEIAINNSSGYITGISGGNANASSSDPTYEYNTTNGVLASSTGNVYGIYDLSGGSFEYVAGYYNGSTSSYLTDNGSSFASQGGTSTKYATAYTDTIASSAYKYGDATYETSGWNNDNASFVSSYRPFFICGGSYSSTYLGGVFYFSSFNGSSNGYYSFRVSLAVQ